MRTHNIAIAGFVFKRAIDRAESNDVEFDPQQFGKSTRDPLSTPFADAVKVCWFRRAGLVNGTFESIHSTICAEYAPIELRCTNRLTPAAAAILRATAVPAIFAAISRDPQRRNLGT